MGVYDGDGNFWYVSEATGKIECGNGDDSGYLKQLSKDWQRIAEKLPENGVIGENVVSLDKHKEARFRKAAEDVAKAAEQAALRLEQ